MIENTIIFLQNSILPLGALGVFLASVIEEVIAPIPSALVMTMSGFLLVAGPVSLNTISDLIFKVALPSAFGVTIGSLFVFYVAKYGGKFIIEKWGKYLGLYLEDINKIQQKFSDTNRDELFIGFARVIPIVPSVAISAFCGILQMGLIKYFIITFVGVFLRGIILGIIGWQVGNVYTKYASFISSIESVVLISTGVVILAFIVLKYRGKINF